jgi:hypothetical protein
MLIKSHGTQDITNIRFYIHHIREDSPRRDKKSRLYKRAIVFCFSVACPALTFYPARAFGCLHGKYGMVCSLACPQVKGRSGIGGLCKPVRHNSLPTPIFYRLIFLTVTSFNDTPVYPFANVYFRLKERIKLHYIAMICIFEYNIYSQGL